MAYSQNFPAQRPSFMFDAANSGRIPPNATFSRSDSPIDASKAAASAVHFWSNEKHLSSENLLLDSKTGTGNWTALNVGGAALPAGTADHAAPPSGGANAATRVQLDLSGGTASGDIAMYYQNRSVASGTSATYSVWLKATDGTSTYAAQIIGANGADSDVTITGSWQKFTVTGTSGGANDSYGVRLRGSQTPTNADTADILMWGANLSTTGETVLNATTTQIHREYAPTLKSVATAGQARFEYDPTDGQSAGTSLGISIESQSTNLVTYSSDITQSFFTGFRSTQESNVGIAPDGTLTADLLREDSTSNNSHGVFFEYASGGTTAQTISVYAKAAGRNHLSFRFDSTNGVFGSDFVYFNLSTGAVGTTDSDITASIESCGNGWYRCIATRTALASANGRIGLYLADADNSTSYDGDSYSGVLLWGIQAEANSSHASSLIATSGASATRAADSLSMTDASLFNTGTGGLVVEAVVKSLNDGVAAWLGTDGNNYHQVGQFGSTTYPLISKADGVASAVLSSAAVSTGAAHKVAASWDTNDFAGCVDGGTVVTDTSGTLPAVNKLTVGNYNAAAAWLDGHVKRVALYSEALTDTTLQALTS